jgi:hypothetical protein
MVTPYEDPNLINEWKQLKEKIKTKENLPTYKVYEKIASMYGVSRSTVYHWLEPSCRATKRLYRILHPEKFGKRKGKRKYKPRKRPGRHLKPEQKAYDKIYKRFIRSLHKYIPQAFHDTNQLTLEKLSDNLAEIADNQLLHEINCITFSLMEKYYLCDYPVFPG